MKSELDRQPVSMDGFTRSNGGSDKAATVTLLGSHQNTIFAFAATPLFQAFLLLQVLDALTTLRVLQNGGYETNPLVNNLMTLGALNGLLIAKLAAVAIGAAVLSFGRPRVLVIANFVYAAVVSWNLMALFAA